MSAAPTQGSFINMTPQDVAAAPNPNEEINQKHKDFRAKEAGLLESLRQGLGVPEFPAAKKGEPTKKTREYEMMLLALKVLKADHKALVEENAALKAENQGLKGE